MQIKEQNVTLKYTYNEDLINIAFFSYYDQEKYLGELTINESDQTVYISDYLKKHIIQTDKLTSKFFEPCKDKWEKIR